MFTIFNVNETTKLPYPHTLNTIIKNSIFAFQEKSYILFIHLQIFPFTSYKYKLITEYHHFLTGYQFREVRVFNSLKYCIHLLYVVFGDLNAA